MAAKVPTPTKEEIAIRAREIRRSWSPSETARRCVYKTNVLYVPIPEELLTDRCPCRAEYSRPRRLMRLD